MATIGGNGGAVTATECTVGSGVRLSARDDAAEFGPTIQLIADASAFSIRIVMEAQQAPESLGTWNPMLIVFDDEESGLALFVSRTRETADSAVRTRASGVRT